MALNQVTATVPQIGRFSGSAAYTVAELGAGVTRSISGSITADLGPLGRISALEQVQTNSSDRLGVDWQRDIPSLGGTLRAGVGRIHEFKGGRSRYVPLGTISMTLPFQQNLQVSYSGEPGTVCSRSRCRAP